MNKLNIEIVKKAISEIRSTGAYPSFKAILKHVGYGSYSTLTKLKAQYPSVFDTQATTVVNTVVNTVDNTPTTDIDTLINTKINTHFNALEQRFEQLKSELLTELKKNSSSELNKVKSLQQQIATLKAQNTQLKTTNDKLAAENMELRKLVESPEPFTLDEAHERLIELFEQYPEKTQAELGRLLDSEGYKNGRGKKFGSSTIFRWIQAHKHG